MLFAKDRKLNQIVSADIATYYSRYTCPACYAPVTLRAKDSYFISPYFAHLKGVANSSSCEYFVSSMYENSYIYRPIDDINQNLNLFEENDEVFTLDEIEESKLEYSPKDEKKLLAKFNQQKNIFSKNLFLDFENGIWSLNLVLNFLRPLKRWSGYISINSLLGEKRLSVDNFAGKHALQIDFSFTYSDIKANGNVDQEILKEIIEADIYINKEELNFFSYPYGTGRKLSKYETLKLGEIYTILSKNELVILKKFSYIIKFINNAKGFYFYSLDLLNELDQKELNNLMIFLKRNISQKKPDLKLIQPLPLFIDMDGAVGVPISTKKLLFEANVDPGVLNYKFFGASSTDIEIETNEKFISVDFEKPTAINILFRDNLLLRIEKVNPINKAIEPFTIKIDENEFSLFDSLALYSSSRSSSSFQLINKWKFLDNFKIIDYHHNEIKKNERISFNNLLVLNAFNYGFLSLLLEPSINKDLKSKKSDVGDKLVRWLNSLPQANVNNAMICPNIISHNYPVLKNKYLPIYALNHINYLRKLLTSEA